MDLDQGVLVLSWFPMANHRVEAQPTRVLTVFHFRHLLAKLPPTASSEEPFIDEPVFVAMPRKKRRPGLCARLHPKHVGALVLAGGHDEELDLTALIPHHDGADVKDRALVQTAPRTDFWRSVGQPADVQHVQRPMAGAAQDRSVAVAAATKRILDAHRVHNCNALLGFLLPLDLSGNKHFLQPVANALCFLRVSQLVLRHVHIQDRNDLVSFISCVHVPHPYRKVGTTGHYHTGIRIGPDGYHRSDVPTRSEVLVPRGGAH
mmetsp:Transcript_59003/g.170593  ORF Transcript_59003/g.170593 Transcript_59003/m.170593 type:complete len:262 (-) Transcript_59003:169-954(-)